MTTPSLGDSQPEPLPQGHPTGWQAAGPDAAGSQVMLVSGLGELVPIILNTSIACGLTVRPHANTIVDTVTYLVDV